MAMFSGLARLGRDAELRRTPGGDAVTNLSLAFNYGRRGGDGKRPTTWVDASLWGKLAEVLAEYLKKGTQVAVHIEELHIEEFESRNGSGHKLVGRVVSIELASNVPRRDEQQEQPRTHGQMREQQRSNGAAAQGHGTQRQAQQPAPKSGTGFDDMDDDIPFQALGSGGGWRAI